MALSDHRRYLERKNAAMEMKTQYENQTFQEKDYRLKPNEKIKITLPKVKYQSINHN